MFESKLRYGGKEKDFSGDAPQPTIDEVPWPITNCAGSEMVTEGGSEAVDKVRTVCVGAYKSHGQIFE